MAATYYFEFSPILVERKLVPSVYCTCSPAKERSMFHKYSPLANKIYKVEKGQWSIVKNRIWGLLVSENAITDKEKTLLILKSVNI